VEHETHLHFEQDFLTEFVTDTGVQFEHDVLTGPGPDVQFQHYVSTRPDNDVQFEHDALNKESESESDRPRP